MNCVCILPVKMNKNKILIQVGNKELKFNTGVADWALFPFPLRKKQEDDGMVYHQHVNFI